MKAVGKRVVDGLDARIRQQRLIALKDARIRIRRQYLACPRRIPARHRDDLAVAGCCDRLQHRAPGDVCGPEHAPTQTAAAAQLSHPLVRTTRVSGHDYMTAASRANPRVYKPRTPALL